MLQCQHVTQQREPLNVQDVLIHHHAHLGFHLALPRLGLTKANVFVVQVRTVVLMVLRPVTSVLQMETAYAEAVVVHVIPTPYWISALAVFLLQLLYLEICLQHARYSKYDY